MDVNKYYNDLEADMDSCVVQRWVLRLTMMQQSVLFTAVRGPDGLPKYHHSKYLLRWYRRCILKSAMDRDTLTEPFSPNGGSFTGPSLLNGDRGRAWEEEMNEHVGAYLRAVDELPHHFQLHFMHAAEILGYKHPDRRIRDWWHKTYLRLVHDMHVWPETEEQLDSRLGDCREQWLERADPATAA